VRGRERGRGGGKRDGHTHNYILTHSIIGEISGHKNNALHLAKAKWREREAKNKRKKEEEKIREHGERESSRQDEREGEYLGAIHYNSFRHLV
jgi:hypothetical protein